EQEQVLGALRASGADFLGGIARVTGLLPTAALEALWALAWAGAVTNDTFAPVRQAVRPAGKTSGARKGRATPMQTGTGRWSLTARLLPPSAGEGPAEIYTRILLERYGVVTREAVQSEDGPVTWPEVFSVLKRMEWKGQVRQGYFIRDLSGAQFALPEAVERLRAARDTAAGNVVRAVAACDPANAYGSILPAPEGVRRVASAYLVLEDGRPVLLVESGGKRLTPLADLDGDALRRALGGLKELLAGSTLKRIDVESFGGAPVYETAIAELLQELGFERTPSKLVLYR
ncbi:MAG TPA: hypothetical protein VK464_17735, partial [Symbiobacteriaceae bacterium]|nr:hypothetical protein [Symbiobacteriaceae bacterium]